MFLQSYAKEMFRPKCNHNFVSVHCVARLEDDLSEVLPYLNAALGGSDYVKDPPVLTLRSQGKLITLHSREIFINALKDDDEADKILNWLKKEINEAWDNRDRITPSFETVGAPKMMEILKLLPRTNCGKCGEPTCTVFAVTASQGVKGPGDCPDMEPDKKSRLEDYLSRFVFDL